MDNKLAQLKRQISGSRIAWEAYQRELARCGIKHHMDALCEEAEQLEAQLERIRVKSKEIQATCPHRYKIFVLSHSAGIECVDCRRSTGLFHTICRNPAPRDSVFGTAVPCGCGSMKLKPSDWTKSLARFGFSDEAIDILTAGL